MKRQENEEKIYLDLDFEHLLSDLYGKSNYHGAVGLKDCNQWRSVIMKIIDAFEKGILHNINPTDNHQIKGLLRLTEESKADILKSKTIDGINHDTIMGMTKLIFTLIGAFPDNWNRDLVNNSKHWKLDKYRSIHYTQSLKQKAKLILKLACDSDYNNGLPPIDDITNKFYISFQSDEKKFVSWFKEQYAENYIKIFLM